MCVACLLHVLWVELTLGETQIYQPLSSVRAHREGSEALWEWFKANYYPLLKKLPPGLSMLGSVVSICSNNFTTEEQAKMVHDFFSDKDTQGFDRALAQTMDSIHAKASWVSRDRCD